MKLSKKQRRIVETLVEARRAYLDADDTLENAGEAYINTFGQNSRRLFALPDGSVVDVDVPANECLSPEVTIHEADSIVNLNA